jgi:hypothetical protein
MERITRGDSFDSSPRGLWRRHLSARQLDDGMTPETAFSACRSGPVEVGAPIPAPAHRDCGLGQSLYLRFEHVCKRPATPPAMFVGSHDRRLSAAARARRVYWPLTALHQELTSGGEFGVARVCP